MRMAEAHQGGVLGVASVSAACFLASIIAIPWLVSRTPTDYFVREQGPQGSVLVRVLRNLAGLALLITGVAMLVLPGQGLLSILLALTLLDFPGKQALLRRLVVKKGVAKALQWLRDKTHKPPFELPQPRTR